MTLCERTFGVCGQKSGQCLGISGQHFIQLPLIAWWFSSIQIEKVLLLKVAEPKAIKKRNILHGNSERPVEDFVVLLEDVLEFLLKRSEHVDDKRASLGNLDSALDLDVSNALDQNLVGSVQALVDQFQVLENDRAGGRHVDRWVVR